MTETTTTPELVKVSRLVPENKTMECPWCGGVGRHLHLMSFLTKTDPVTTCHECAGSGIVAADDPEHQKKARLHR